MTPFSFIVLTVLSKLVILSALAKKIGSFGFSAFTCVSAKTKCAYLRVGLFSHEAQRSG
jgi:hypothetical protein